jgi:hypothetical protein
MVVTEGTEPGLRPTKTSPPDAEALFKEARRRERRRRLTVGGAMILVVGVLATLAYLLVTSVTSGGAHNLGPTKAPTTPFDVPPVVPNNWSIVFPGGMAGSSSSPGSLSLLEGNSHVIRQVEAPPSNASSETTFPWAVSGPYVGAVINDGKGGTPYSAHGSKQYEGVAYAFRPDGKAARLGPAAAIYSAVQPGRFWLQQNSGTTCSLVEVSAIGRRLTGELTRPCHRWLVAAATGGFVSIPTTRANHWSGAVQSWEFGLGGAQPSPETPLQLWNPLTNRVVRDYSVNPYWIDGVNSSYLVAQTKSEIGSANVEITDLASGLTHQLSLPLSHGDVLLNEPVLAPEGPYLAWEEVASAELPKIESEDGISPGGIWAPIESGPGKVRVVDLTDNRLAFSRSLTLGSDGAFDWAPDDHYLFVTNGWSSISVVPTWSQNASMRKLKFDRATTGPTGTPATEELLIAARLGS